MSQYRLADSEARSEIFNNHGAVASQVGTQNVYGNIHYLTPEFRGGEHVAYNSSRDKEEQIRKRRSQYHKSLTFDLIEARYTTIKSAHMKTCQWLLTRPEYTDWQRDDKLFVHQGLLWMKGKPGTGKSTLMKFAFANIQKQESHTIVLSFFFNARGEVLEKSTLGMYRSLLFQLLSKIPELLMVFDKFRVGQDEIDPADWNIATLTDLFSRSIKALGRCRVTCFIDALDECDEEQARDMLSIFEQLGQEASMLGTPFRMFLSSRHYPHISISHGVELVLEEQVDHDLDLTTYLQSELRIRSSEIALKVRQDLLQRASGIFLWVVLVTRILNREHDKGNIMTLKKRLDEIPDGLEALFDDILARDETPRAQLIMCIQWVLFARQPLQPDELYCAILCGTNPELVSPWDQYEISQQDIQRYILNCSRGLLEQTRGGHPTIQFIHESVRDYFLTGHGLASAHSSTTVSFTAQGHDRLKNCCVSYYSRALELDTTISTQSLLKVTSSGSKNPPPSLVSKIEIAFPFLKYSAKSALYHSEMAQRHGCDQEVFVQNFALDQWTMARNFSTQHDVWYPPNVSLLYVLVAEGLGFLAKQTFVQDQLGAMGGVVCGSHKSLLRAALASGKNPIIELLFLLGHENSGSELSRRFDIAQASAELLQNDYVGSPLPIFLQAARYGHVSLVRCMMRTRWHGEVCNIESALDLVARFGDEKVIQALLDAGADISPQGGYKGGALQGAVKFNRLEILQTLLKAGADVNSQYGYYGSALEVAAWHGNEEIVRILLDAGADVNVNAQGNNQGTALQVAKMRGHEKIVQMLLEAGADSSPS